MWATVEDGPPAGSDSVLRVTGVETAFDRDERPWLRLANRLEIGCRVLLSLLLLGAGFMFLARLQVH